MKQLGQVANFGPLGTKTVEWLIHFYARITSGSHTRGSLVILTNPTGEILLTESTYKSIKGFVGGLPNNRKEQPIDTIQREMREEIGLTISRPFTPLGVYIQKNIRHIDAVYHLALTAQEVDDIAIDDDELSDISWFPLSEAQKILDDDRRAILDLYLERQASKQT